jgi:hypothetical protein
MINNGYSTSNENPSNGEPVALTDHELELVLGGSEYQLYQEQTNNPTGNALDLRDQPSHGPAVDVGAIANAAEVSAGIGVVIGGATGAAIGSPGGPAGTVAGALGGAELGAAVGAGAAVVTGFVYELGQEVVNHAGEFFDYVGEVQATTDKM